MRLLVIEDESRICEFVSEALRRAGFAVDCFATLGDARAALAGIAYDAVVLDRGLPDGDGLELFCDLRSLAERPPVLILTAKDTVDARVAGLDAGADDYLVKPFAMVELVARIKALLRRPGGALGVRLEAGALLLDTVGRDASVRGAPLALGRQEVAILEHLMRRLGRVVPKTLLEEKLYGIDDELGSNAIPVHVHHLRRKLAEVDAGCAIHTVRGIGYFLREEAP